MKIAFLTPPIDASPYCWLVEIGPNKLGVHVNDGWCMQLGERLIVLDSEGKCVPLEPILELEENAFFNFLEDVKKAFPAYAAAINHFPKVILLKHVFHTSFSGYWPERALTWLDADPGIQSLLQEELRMFAEKKTMPQGARQKARRILNHVLRHPN